MVQHVPRPRAKMQRGTRHGAGDYRERAVGGLHGGCSFANRGCSQLNGTSEDGVKSAAREEMGLGRIAPEHGARPSRNTTLSFSARGAPRPAAWATVASGATVEVEVGTRGDPCWPM